MGRLRRLALGISTDEACPVLRGFRGDDDVARRHLEHVGVAFLVGYNASLEEDDVTSLASRLKAVEAQFRGFAFEGAAMGLFLLDHLAPWGKGRFRELREGVGASHVYMVIVGAGWAIARLPWLRFRMAKALSIIDPLLCWLAVDGYGFHDSYFGRRDPMAKGRIPGRLRGYASRAFDQGMGRSLWFTEGADTDRIASRIAEFPPHRRPDLWSGIGLACAYAGSGVDFDVRRLQAHSDHPDHLAQGAAFAAKARHLAGNTAPHTEHACEVLCGMSAVEAALLTDEAQQGLPDSEVEASPPYEVWRTRIRESLARHLAIS